MRVRDAKDFLVQQTSDQAGLDAVPFSDLEKRMMYFTEGKHASEDPVSLHDEFEAQCDSSEFEKKVSRLMRHAYARLKKDEPEKALKWKEAIRTLRSGDHYILVLAGQHLGHGSLQYWRLLGVFLVPIALFYLFTFLFSPRTVTGRPPYWHSLPIFGPYTLKVMQVLYFSLLLAAIFVPRVFEPATKWALRLFDRLAGIKVE